LILACSPLDGLFCIALWFACRHLVLIQIKGIPDLFNFAGCEAKIAPFVMA